MCIYIYIYIYIYNFKAINKVLDAKMLFKTHLFIKNIKIFSFLYRSFVSLKRILRNIKQNSTQQVIKTN